MAYDSGTATSVFDLLAKIKTFFENNGWTINSYIADRSFYDHNATSKDRGSSDQKRLHVSKGSVYLNFRSVDRPNSTIDYTWRTPFSVGGHPSYQIYGRPLVGLAFNRSLGYDVSKNWAAQPGAPVALGNTNGGIGVFGYLDGAIVSYKMFLKDDPVFFFHLCIEYSVGVFCHFYAGDILKEGSYTGGEFFTGPIWAAHVIMYDVFSGAYVVPNSGFSPFIGSNAESGNCNLFFRIVDSFNSTTRSNPSGWVFEGVPLTRYTFDNTNMVSIGRSSLTPLNNKPAQTCLYLMASMPSSFIGPMVALPVPLYLPRDGNYASLAGVMSGILTTYSQDVGIKTYGDKTYMLIPANRTTDNFRLLVEYDGPIG